MNFGAVILAGGRSRRMGRNKAAMIHQGRSLFGHQLETVKRLSPDHVFGSVAVDQPVEVLDCTLVYDAWTDAGPLGGLHAVLAQAPDPLLLVLAVDMPLMTADYLGRLLSRCRDGCGVVPVRQGRYEPLAAVYPREVLALAEAALARGVLSMQAFVGECLGVGLMTTTEVPSDCETLFTNWNWPEDVGGANDENGRGLASASGVSAKLRP